MINRPSKRLFFNFCFFHFPKFQMTIVKSLTEKPSFLKWISMIFMTFYYITNIFYQQMFDYEKRLFLKVSEICMEMHFVSLFSLNEKSITTSLLTIHSKCTVVHYGNLNWSSIKEPFLNYGPSNMLFCFFRFLISVYFNEASIKTLWKNYHFLIQISKIQSKM